MANRHWVGGTDTWNATAGTKWSDVSGGVGGFSTPTTSDVVYLDAASGAVTVTMTAGACYTLTCTGFTGTLNINGTLSHGGVGLTFDAGMTLSTTGGTPHLSSTNAIVITSNGKIWPGSWSSSFNLIHTITGDFEILGTSFFSGRNCSFNCTGGTEVFRTAGLLHNTGLTTTMVFSVNVQLTGGTWNGQIHFGRYVCSVGFEFTLNGNVTFFNHIYYNGKLRYIAGTITTTGSAFSFQFSHGQQPSVYSAGMSFHDISVQNTAGAVNLTLLSNLTATGTFSPNQTTISGAYTFSTVSLNMASGFVNGSSFILTGGGTWSGGQYVGNQITFTGSTTVSGTVTKQSGAIIHTSGTITTTSSTLTIIGSCALDTGSISWNNVSVTASSTLTLTTSLTGNGILSSASAVTTTLTSVSSSTATFNGVTCTGNVGGTASLYLLSGTWSGAGTLSTNTFLQGNVTVSGSVVYSTRTLTYVSGTITTTGSTLNLAGCTLDTSTVVWNTITTTTTTGQTYTINSSLLATTLNLGITAVQTFAGTTGFTVVTLSCATTSAVTINFKESVTYTITGSFTCELCAVGSMPVFTSSHAATRANIVMPNNGSNLCNLVASFTRINATGGRTLNSFGGTITDCLNVRQFYDYQVVGL